MVGRVCQAVCEERKHILPHRDPSEWCCRDQAIPQLSSTVAAGRPIPPGPAERKSRHISGPVAGEQVQPTARPMDKSRQPGASFARFCSHKPGVVSGTATGAFETSAPGRNQPPRPRRSARARTKAGVGRRTVARVVFAKARASSTAYSGSPLVRPVRQPSGQKLDPESASSLRLRRFAGGSESLRGWGSAPSNKKMHFLTYFHTVPEQ